MFLRLLLKTLLLPPAINLMVIAFALLLPKSLRQLARALIALSALSLWLLCTPVVSSMLAISIERYPAIDPQQAVQSGAKAIVVLGASHIDTAPEYGASSPNDDGLVRLHYAAHLHRRTELPLLLTGGPTNKLQRVHSRVLDRSLRQEYDISAAWIETKSATTWQNALYSAEILHPVGIRDIVLLSHAYHLPRAVKLFETAGFNVTAAPTRVNTQYPWNNWRFWLPSAVGLDLSAKVLHEYLGLLWYQFVSPVDNRIENELKLYMR